MKISIAFVESQQISTSCLEESLMLKNEVYNCLTQMVTPQDRNSALGGPGDLPTAYVITQCAHAGLRQKESLCDSQSLLLLENRVML